MIHIVKIRSVEHFKTFFEENVCRKKIKNFFCIKLEQKNLKFCSENQKAEKKRKLEMEAGLIPVDPDWLRYENVREGQNCSAEFRTFSATSNRPIVAISSFPGLLFI